MIHKLARALTRKPKLIAFLAVLLLIPSAIGMAATKINYDLLTYLPEEMDSSQGMELLEEPFHMAATSMLIVEDMPADYTNRLLRDIQNVPGVSSAIWVSSLVGIQIPTDMIPADFREMFFSGEGTMMIIQYEQPGASEETMAAIDEIRSLCNKNCYLAGFSVALKDTKDLADREIPIYVGLAVLLALGAMLLTLESTVLPFAFLLCIGMAILYNFGTNIFLGQISYITKAIAAVLQLGVTMDYSIFLYRRYVEECGNHADKRDAMAAAVEAAFASLSGSSLTTVAGFVALCFMRLTLGRDIGIVMAKGVVLGVLSVIFVLPSMLLLFDSKIAKHRHRELIPSMEKLNRHLVRKRGVYVAIFLLLFLPFSVAQNMTEVYYKLDQSLPRDMASIVANEKLKDEYDMASSHFILVRDDLSSQELGAMEREIQGVDGVTSLVSYHSILGSGIPDFFVPEEVRGMLKTGGWQMLMVNSEYTTATDEVAQQLAELQRIVKSHDESGIITGEAALTNDLIETSAVDFKTTNYISIAAIFLIIAIVFKSLSVPVVLVAAIELAIFINQGIPYFTGTVIPFVSPTIIGCIQLGATVDYAILMTTRFQEELRAGKDRKDAAIAAATSSDSSILTSALVLFAATLGVSVASDIEIIGSICSMLARGALISAAVIILLLPPVLCVCEPVFHRTSIGWRKPRPIPAERAVLPETAAPETPKTAFPKAEKRHPHFGRKGKASVPDERETREERETVGSGKP